jgi:hypothetical protein
MVKSLQLTILPRAFFGMLVLLSVFGATGASAATLTASLDRPTTTAGESVLLTLSFEGGAPAGAPSLPSMPNVQVAYRGQSSEFRIINGQTTARVSHSYALTPLQPGDITIPAIRAQVGNQIVSSQPLTLRVLRGGQAVPGQPRVAFMQLVLPKTEIYVGEVLPVDIKLYAMQGRLLQQPQLQAQSFTLGKMVQLAASREQVDGQLYNVVTFRTSIVAIKSGPLSLGPVTMEFGVPDQSRGSNFFGQFQLRQTTLIAEAQPVQVLPLPPGRPGDFTGAVGTFQLNMTASPTNVAVSDPITLRIQISGRGAIDAITLPEQPAWREFRVYPPTRKVETDAEGIAGTAVFEQVVAPLNPEIKQLPPFSFSFFEPDLKVYETLVQPAIPLTVRPTSATPLPTVFAGNNAAENSAPSSDLVHIKPQLGVVGALQQPQPLIQQPWFLALQAIAPLAWFVSAGWKRYQVNLSRNPRLRRKRQVARTVRQGLNELSRHAAANESDPFFATVFRLLQEQIGERLDLPASAITEEVIDEQLRPLGMSDELARTLHELFQLCNQARYTPVRSSRELTSVIPKVSVALKELQGFKP